jgi:hypothetical protein
VEVDVPVGCWRFEGVRDAATLLAALLPDEQRAPVIRDVLLNAKCEKLRYAAATRYLPFAFAMMWVISSAVSVGQCCFRLLTFGRSMNARLQFEGATGFRRYQSPTRLPSETS